MSLPFSGDSAIELWSQASLLPAALIEVWVVEGPQIQNNQFVDPPLIYVIDFWLFQSICQL